MLFVMYTLYSCMIVALFSYLFLVIGRNLLDRLNMESGNSYWDLAAAFLWEWPPDLPCYGLLHIFCIPIN